MSLIIIACGGTGGHLSPGIALAEKLLESGQECLLVVSRKKIDARLLEKYPHLQFLRAPGTGWSANLAGRLRFLASQTWAVLFAAGLVLRRRPAVLVSFGGFLTLGLALVCRLAGVPVVLHEANRVPGKAVRMLGKIATRVWLPPGVALGGVAAGKQRSAGFPVRKEFALLERAEARRALEFPETGNLVLVLGGSQGAAPLNAWVTANAQNLSGAGIHVLCVTGPEKAAAEPPCGNGTGVVRFVPFCDRMPEALSAADLVVSRSGAGSIAEFMACALPSVLVPYPFAADNHQEANARFLETLGGGTVLSQKDIGTLSEVVGHLLSDTSKLAQMRENLRAARDKCAWQPMVTDILRLAGAKAEK
ncbi:MAG: UDP-N-acetylglucosamine--N-acetylmuramyl-(pentapeptide) pyrophosphoryl-undecaprenol N-acetylglucosamine transferase [Puniceicoccales bacterium]|jgi:UDP-N-acetylglucosamine--N-acetylmuramyl-(pentapeptide) pyrophosphoryl-undecaprenol N-acetylglucosamine transferase|nr:UDP-N-acetylglucosamine--N-acetylmuramyl-(pentapeptide) pyrophosphoryl-undecaprenol N-acetylglucosamine transferase [Puniceicoccales bacterium]